MGGGGGIGDAFCSTSHWKPPSHAFGWVPQHEQTRCLASNPAGLTRQLSRRCRQSSSALFQPGICSRKGSRHRARRRTDTLFWPLTRRRRSRCLRSNVRATISDAVWFAWCEQNPGKQAPASRPRQPQQTVSPRQVNRGSPTATGKPLPDNFPAREKRGVKEPGAGKPDSEDMRLNRLSSALMPTPVFSTSEAPHQPYGLPAKKSNPTMPAPPPPKTMPSVSMTTAGMVGNTVAAIMCSGKQGMLPLFH